MKAKIIEDVLFEKFVEESDPIQDMGIGKGIGKTKYRTFAPNSYIKILQYRKSITIFGKIIERWLNVPLPLSISYKKSKRSDEDSENENSYRYYVTSKNTNFKTFINQWPFIKDYLKHVKTAEEK